MSILFYQNTGAAPINAIIHGDEVTGVTTMYLASGWDSGDIILKPKNRFFPDTAGALHDRAKVGSLGRDSAAVGLGSSRIPQDHDQATYAFKRSRPMHWLISRNPPPSSITIRGMNPWPLLTL